MAKRKSKGVIQQHTYVRDTTKVGKPRTPKVFKKKGNAAARTSSSGNGSRIR
tara:strand:- start:197 stop:352 length:156 start_codon:yes stop_codon:yes gene_type:complete